MIKAHFDQARDWAAKVRDWAAQQAGEWDKTAPAVGAQGSIRRHLIAGLMIVLLLGGGVGGWAATVQISGALIAQGSIVVDQNVQKVQHPTGGIVGELLVRDGDRVKAGSVLVRLDETVMRANLAIVTKGLDQLTARKARLEAERDGAEAIRFPAALLSRMADVDIRDTIDSERKLFDLRRTERTGQKAQLQQRMEQLKEEIAGIEAQQVAKTREIELIDRELGGVRDLYSRNLVQLTRLTQLERETARLNGERAQLVAAAAQAKGKISEISLQIIQIDQNLSSEVAKELRDIDSKIGEFVERKVTAEDQLRRTDIRAPQTGTVFQSTVHTVGGVISAGDPIMLIVPDADKLQVEARVNPQDIDQLLVGQTAVLRFSAFNSRTTPEIDGKVTRVSADTSTDQRTGASYYTIRIGLPPENVARLGDVRLLPGMPVEAFVQTGDRTVISYLMKPLSDQFNRAFREK
jgi:HlyD family secretion protein